jgi:hypothetical protein
LQEGFELVPPGIVDQDIDFPEGLQDTLCHLLDFNEIGDISLQGHHVHPGVPGDLRRRLLSQVSAQIGNGHARSRTR